MASFSIQTFFITTSIDQPRWPPRTEVSGAQELLQRRQYLGGGILARLHGTFHLAVPFGRGFGPSPMQRVDRRAQLGPVGRPQALRPITAVGAAGKRVITPFVFQIKRRVRGIVAQIWPEVGAKLLEHLGSPYRQGLRSELARPVTFDKGDQDARCALGR